MLAIYCLFNIYESILIHFSSMKAQKAILISFKIVISKNLFTFEF